MRIAPTKMLCDDCVQPRYWLRLPTELRKWGQALLHQQCWCWGCDIRREQGNWLLEQGFVRTRPPEGRKGSPTYCKALDEQRTITLWGFGMCLSQAGTGNAFISRFGFSPRLSSHTSLSRQVWKIEHMTDFCAPHTLEACQTALDLLGDALCWMSQYEHHILTVLSASYRQRTLEPWSHTVLPPQDMPDEWARLSRLCCQRAIICKRDADGIQHQRAYKHL